MSDAISSPPAHSGEGDSTTNGAMPLRRIKICLLGSSQGGKTSLVKSITSAQPHLVAIQDRTIGIDLYTHTFTDANAQDYEVVFWDFAGQDVYQVANALFFSSRTLYLLCVDLEVYAAGMSKAKNASSWDREAITQRFIEQQVFRWARMIFARQPDANLVVVGTKSDLLAENPTLLKRVETDLQSRISEWCKNFARRLEKGDVLRDRARDFFKQRSLIVSVKTDETVQAARQSVEDLCSSVKTLGLPMSESYTSVLASLRSRRDSCGPLCLGHMKKLIRSAEKLENDLVSDCQGLKRDEVRTILQDFHDQGDVLWYYHENAGGFKEFVILDPSIVLDLVRELINHTYQECDNEEYMALQTRGEVTHALLLTFPTWSSLASVHDDAIYLFKQLMRFYQLAYPVGGPEMTSKSDLIVPTYWKSKKQPPLKRTISKNASMIRREQLSRSFTGYWQYAVPAELSEAIFDQFIVQSHSFAFTRTVTASFVEAKLQGKFVARIFFEQGTHKTDNIRIEVVASSDLICWTSIRFFVLAMEIVIERYPGLNDVSRHILHHEPTSNSGEESYALEFAIKDFEDARRLGISFESTRRNKPWLPPTLDWYVNKTWLQPNALAELEDVERKRQTAEFKAAIQRLCSGGEKRRTLPALFSVCSPGKADGFVDVQLMSDLSGVGHREPFSVPLPDEVKTKFASSIQTGVSVFSTVPANCLVQSVVDEVLETSRTGLVEPAEYVREVHKTFGATQGAKISPPVAADLLQQLLKLHDPESDDVAVMMDHGFYCAKAESGHFVWATKQELELAGNFIPLDYKTVRREVDASKKGGLSPVTSSARLTRFKFGLKNLSATGVPTSEQNKCFCSWELRRPNQSALESGETGVFAADKTGTKSVSAQSITWTDEFRLGNIASLAALRECELEVKIKRRRHWLGSSKTIWHGKLILARVLEDEKKPTTMITITARDGIYVDGQLTVEEITL